MYSAQVSPEKINVFVLGQVAIFNACKGFCLRCQMGTFKGDTYLSGMAYRSPIIIIYFIFIFVPFFVIIQNSLSLYIFAPVSIKHAYKLTNHSSLSLLPMKLQPL